MRAPTKEGIYLTDTEDVMRSNRERYQPTEDLGRDCHCDHAAGMCRIEIGLRCDEAPKATSERAS